MVIVPFKATQTVSINAKVYVRYREKYICRLLSSPFFKTATPERDHIMPSSPNLKIPMSYIVSASALKWVIE